MKMYLSSYLVGKEGHKLCSLIHGSKHAAVIMNASDGYGDEKRHYYYSKYSEELKKLGISTEELDLRKYFRKQESLNIELERFGLLWVTGGNTFILRKALANSGLDQILKNKKNHFVYGGFSAGVCVLSPSLKGIHLADEPDSEAVGYQKEIIWDCLDLIDFYIVPHFRSNHPESEAMENVVNFYQENDFSYQTLQDGEVIIIEYFQEPQLKN